MAALERTKARTIAESVIVLGGFAYLFALFNPHLTAVSNLGLYLPFVASLALALSEPRILGELGKLGVVRWMLAATVVLFAAALYSPDRAYSVSAFRREWLKVVIAALTFGTVFVTSARHLQLLRALGFAAATMVLLELVQYGRELAELGRFSDDIARHRWYADSLIFFIPTVLALTWLARGRVRVAWACLLGLQFLLLAATSARGAWLGAALAVALAWPMLRLPRRALIGLAATGSLAVAAAVVILPSSLTTEALERGMSTTYRIDGTWGPAFEMAAERPLLGFGYGGQRFHDEYNRRADEHPWWFFRSSKGPHSTYLQVLFSAGLVGLVPLIFWFASLFGTFWNFARAQPVDPGTQALCYAGIGAFAAYYLGRGFVEFVRWAPLGMIGAIAIGLALQTARKRDPTGRSSGQP